MARKKEVHVRRHGEEMHFDLRKDQWRTAPIFGIVTYEDFMAMPESERDTMFVRGKRYDELNVIEIHATHARCKMDHVFLNTTTSETYREQAKPRVKEIVSRGNVAIVDLVKCEVREAKPNA